MPKSLPLVLSSVCALGAAQSALGVTIEYALDRQPDLVACDRAAYRGARAEAQQCFIALLAKSDDLRLKADAARASGDVRMANTLFQEAIKQYPEDARLRARWGDLFLATHQNNEAAKLFQESLMLDEHYARRRDNRKLIWTLLVFQLWHDATMAGPPIGRAPDRRCAALA